MSPKPKGGDEFTPILFVDPDSPKRLVQARRRSRGFGITRVVHHCPTNLIETPGMMPGWVFFLNEYAVGKDMQTFFRGTPAHPPDQAKGSKINFQYSCASDRRGKLRFSDVSGVKLYPKGLRRRVRSAFTQNMGDAGRVGFLPARQGGSRASEVFSLTRARGVLTCVSSTAFPIFAQEPAR